MPPGDSATSLVTSSAPTLAQFRAESENVNGEKGKAFELKGSDLKVTKHSVANGADTKAAMHSAKAALEVALREVAENDPQVLAKLKELVDPKFDRKDYLSSARVKAFFAKYQDPEAMKRAARIHGSGSDGVPHTLAERTQNAQAIAASWVDTEKFGETVQALTKALDTLKQFEGSRLGDTYKEMKKLGLDFIGAFTAANQARISVENDINEVSVAKLEASIKALEGMPKKIEATVRVLQADIEKIQYTASQDLALSHWGLTNSTNAAILAKAELANKALGVIATAVSTSMGMTPVGIAVKTASSGVLALTTKLVQWHDTGVLKVGPFTKDNRTENQRMEAMPLVLHDRKGAITSDMAEQVVKTGIELLNHFADIGIEDLGPVLKKLAGSPIGAAIEPKWAALLNTLGNPESAPNEIKGAFAALNDVTSTLLDKATDPLVSRFAKVIAEKASTLAQGPRSDTTWDYDNIMGDLDEALEMLTPAKT